MTRSRLLLVYYLASPLFLMLDAALGVELRAAFLDSAGARYGWYAGCFALGLVAWRWPASGPLVGLLESAANFGLLCLAVMVPLLGWTPEGGGPAGLSGARLLGFLLAGSVCVLSFHQAQRQLQGAAPSRRRP